MAVKTPVNGELLEWARVEHGLALDEAAHALSVKPERLASWEAGDVKPTLNQVRKAAALYQRTPAFFLQRDTPSADDHRRPTDFRSFSGDTPTLGNALAREVARARARRHNLMQLQDTQPHTLPALPTVLDEPAAAAGRMREHLGITVEAQTGFANAPEALNSWVRAVEAQGVLVFQMSRVSPDVCRGFSVYEDVLPVIVLNGADGPGARQFTLFHELAHLLSRTSAVCDVWREGGIEAKCNEFAADLLMPRRAVLGFLDRGGRQTAADLAAEFNVSKSAAAVRLRALGRITQEQLDAHLREAREAAIAQREAAKYRSGGPSPHLLKVRNLGPRFVGTVLDAMHDERITVVEAAQILESKVQALDKLEAEVEWRGVAS
jgi:Zn-dependent peptidase ImmA (M78 family)/DNA-binding XRE family transcriptional regulator